MKKFITLLALLLITIGANAQHVTTDTDDIKVYDNGVTYPETKYTEPNGVYESSADQDNDQKEEISPVIGIVAGTLLIICFKIYLDLMTYRI